MSNNRALYFRMAFGTLFRKQNSFLGIDIGAAGVKVVELRKEKGRPVLFTYGLTLDRPELFAALARRTAPITAPTAMKTAVEQSTSPASDANKLIDELAGLVRGVCNQARVRSNTAVVSIPAARVFHALVTVPIAKKEELNRMLEAEIKKLLPYPIEEAQLDFQVIAKDEAQQVQRIMVNAVPRSTVSIYTAICKAAGITLDALEPESVALSRALVGRDSSTTLVVDIGEERTNFFMVDATYPVIQHSIELGGSRVTTLLKDALGIDVALTEQIKRDLFAYLLDNGENPTLGAKKLLRMLMPVVDPITKEIDYCLELYMRQGMNISKYPEKIVLTGGGAFFPFLADHITETFKIKTYIGDPWGRVLYQDGLKNVLRAIAPRMAVAIGLALRNVL